MAVKYHKNLTGTDLHVTKAHASTHASAGADTLGHDDLGSISGGGAADYQHLATTEYTACTRDATNSQNGLMPTAKLDNWDAGYTHISNDGSDHSYIDQDVTSTGTPTFTQVTIDDLVVDGSSILAGPGASGVLTLGGTGGSNNYSMTFDFESVANHIVWSSSDGNVWGIFFDKHFKMPDDRYIAFGGDVTSQDTRIEWETGGTNDYWGFGTNVGSAASSGYISFMERGDIGNANRSPASTSANPVLRVYSSDATQAGDYIEMYHDQTDGNIVTGGGDLLLSPAAGSVVRINETADSKGLEIYGFDDKSALGVKLYQDDTWYSIIEATNNFTFKCGGGMLIDSDGNIVYQMNSTTMMKYVFDTNFDQIGWGLAYGAGKQLVICNLGAEGSDFDHAIASNPTLFIQSNLNSNTSNNQWGSLHHDQTNFIITSGANVGAGTGATTIANAIVFAPRGTEAARIDVGGITATTAIDTPEIANTGGDLKIEPDAEGNITFFEDTDVANNADGRRLIVHRKAAEGDRYFELYINEWQNLIFQFPFSNQFSWDAWGGINFQSNFAQGYGTNTNRTFRQYGQLTDIAAERYIQWQVNDSTDNFELTRQDDNIDNFDIQMPLITDGITASAVIRGATSLWYQEYHLGASQTSPGASGATETELNGVFSWNLDATTEYLYYAVDIHGDWDGATDIEIEVEGYLGEAETANDLIRMSVRCDYGTDHDNANSFKTQTLDVDHDITTNNSQYDVHKIPFTFNWDETDNVLEVGDKLHLRVWLDDITSAPVVTDFNVTFVTVKYKSAHVRIEV